MNLDALQFKMLCKGVHRAISPNEVVLFNRRQKLGPFGERACDSVEHKACVKRCDKRNVDIEPWGILDLRYFKAVHLLTLLVGDEIDLANTIAEGQTLKNAFKTGETAAFSRAVAEDLAADPTGENFADDERGLGLHANFVKAKACRVIVRGEHHDAATANMLDKVGVVHEIDSSTLDFERGVAVKKHVGHSVYFPLPEVTPPADMTDDVLGFEHAGVEQREFADTGHCKLQRDLSAARFHTRQ